MIDMTVNPNSCASLFYIYIITQKTIYVVKCTSKITLVRNHTYATCITLQSYLDNVIKTLLGNSILIDTSHVFSVIQSDTFMISYLTEVSSRKASLHSHITYVS